MVVILAKLFCSDGLIMKLRKRCIIFVLVQIANGHSMTTHDNSLLLVLVGRVSRDI